MFAEAGGPLVHDVAGTNHLRWGASTTVWDRDTSGPVGRTTGGQTELAQTDRPVFEATGPFTILCRFKPITHVTSAGLYALGSTPTDTSPLYRFQPNGPNFRQSWVGGGFSTFLSNFPLDTHYSMISGWDGARAWVFFNSTAATNNAAIADSGANPPFRLLLGASSFAPVWSANAFVDYIAIWAQLLPPPTMRALAADHRLIWSLFRPRPERPFSALYESRRGRRTLYPRIGSRGMRV
jgi:hypothetical protein